MIVKGGMKWAGNFWLNKLAGKSCFTGRNRQDIFSGIFILAGTGFFPGCIFFLAGRWMVPG